MSEGRNARRLALRGTRWQQRQVGGFAVITISIPTVGMPPATYEGLEASDRLRRFCIGFLSGKAEGERAAGRPDPVLEALIADAMTEPGGLN